MKRLLREEKIDLKTELKLFSFYSLFFFLSNFSFSQVPINGFTNFYEIKSIKDQTNLLSFNYNKDAYSDLLIYNRNSRNAFILTGQPNLKFSQPVEIFFKYEPNFFKPVYDINNQITEYAFVSRKSRTFALINFNISGSPRFSNIIKLSSYPNKVDYADIDLDFENDFILYGEAFEGISIISKKNNKLSEKKFFKNISFSDAYFFDINGDEYIDIIGYDVISQKLLLIHNKDGNRFNVEREISLNNKVYKFQILDINFDTFKDLILSFDKGIKIFLGDNLNSFEKSIFIETSSTINDFVIGDFNRDGIFDFVCTSISQNYMSVIFGKEDKRFYEEVIIEHPIEIIDLIPFFTRFVYGVAFLDNKGRVKVISNFKSFNEDINFIYGVKPFSLNTFDFNEDELLDFVFIDKFDNKLKFILRNDRGVPSILFQVNLKGIHSKFFILKKKSKQFVFYAYNLNNRLIEILEINFSLFTFKRDIVYVEGEIQDLWVSGKNEDGEIRVLYSRDNLLNYAILRLSIDKKYKTIKFPLVSEKFLSAKILSESEDKILLWKQTRTMLHLFIVKYLFDSRQEEEKLRLTIDGEISINNYIPKYFENYDYVGSIIKSSNKNLLILLNKELDVLVKSDILSIFNISETSSKINYSESFIYFYDLESKNIFRIIFVKKMNKIVLRKIYENVQLEEFSISSLDNKLKHLIFLASEDSKIKIRNFI